MCFAIETSYNSPEKEISITHHKLDHSGMFMKRLCTSWWLNLYNELRHITHHTHMVLERSSGYLDTHYLLTVSTWIVNPRRSAQPSREGRVWVPPKKPSHIMLRNDKSLHDPRRDSLHWACRMFTKTMHPTKTLLKLNLRLQSKPVAWCSSISYVIPSILERCR